MLDIKKMRCKYLIYAVFLGVFAFIYELFSHGVYSNYMIFAFVIPLIFGFGVSFLFTETIHQTGVMFYNLGILTLSIGSVFKGILDIYGSTNRLLNVYIWAGISLVFLGLVFILLKKIIK